MSLLASLYVNKTMNTFPDYSNCLVNLSNSILKKFGAAATAETLPLADKILNGNYKNVVLLVLDALGCSILEKHLEEDGFFRLHVKGTLDSVYPPTTVAATTSLMSALYPNEHGWLGWDLFYPELDKNVTVFLNCEQAKEKENAVPDCADGKEMWSSESIVRGEPFSVFHAGRKFTPYKSIVERINEAGGNAYFSFPFEEPFPQDLEAVLSRIQKLCAEPEKKFIYSYWMEPDATMHRTGTESKNTHRMVKKLEKQIMKFSETLSDTLLLITADHGHIDSMNLCILDYPEICKCLVRLPSIESRTLSLFVKPEYLKKFPALWKKTFGDGFLLLTREEVLEKNIFGIGKNNLRLETMIGDFVALSVSNKSIFNTHYSAQIHKGNHAGLLPEEIKIPLIAIECN